MHAWPCVSFNAGNYIPVPLHTKPHSSGDLPADRCQVKKAGNEQGLRLATPGYSPTNLEHLSGAVNGYDYVIDCT